MANLLQYSCLENPMDRGAWWARVHGVANLPSMSSQASSNILEPGNIPAEGGSTALEALAQIRQLCLGLSL